MRQKRNRRFQKLGGCIACFLFWMFCINVAVYADTQGTMRASLNATQTSCTIKWSGYTMPSDGEALTVAVWSEEDDQDDLKWTELSLSNGVYSAKISVSAHASAGRYQAHLYLRTKAGKMIFLASKTFTVKTATCTSVTVTDMNTTAGTCKVVISGLNSPSGISKVVVPTWSKGNQSDIVWYPATRQSDGTWTADIDFSKHNNNSGTYQIHVYATSQNNVFNFVGRTAVSYSYEEPEVKLTASMGDQSCKLKATGLSHKDGIKKVYFVVWSDTDGQDDIIWNTASYSSGTATKTIDLKNYCDFGKYNFHVYIITNAGKQIFMGETSFDVPYPSAEKIEVKTEGKTFTVTISGISCVSGIDRVIVPIWSKADQSDLVWYKAVKQEDGSYLVSSDISKHKNNTGTYQIHVYIYDDRDSYGFNCAQRTMSFERSAGDLEISGSEDKTEFAARISSITIPDNYEVLLMAVWSEQDGQDDLKWYELDESGSTATGSFLLADHKNNEGTYNLHLYARQSDYTMLLVKEYTFEISLRNTLIFENKSSGRVDVRVRFSDEITAKKVYFPTWSASDQSDIKWYEGTKQSDGSYKATIDIANHSDHTGTYTVHTYYYDTSGVQHYVCGSTVEMTASDKDATAEIISCRITNGDTVTVTAKVSGSGTFGLFRLPAGSNSIDGTSPLATVIGSGTITLTAPLKANTSSSLINEKLVVAQKRSSGYVVVSNGKYITNPEAIATNTREFPTTSSKKGLQVNTTMAEDAAELGVNHAVINIVLNNIPCESGGISYQYNGKTWHMDMGYIYSLDSVFEEFAANGTVISVVLLMQWDSEYSDLILPSGRTPGYNFYGLNAETQSSREQLAAIFSFLANRYSDSRHNVVNWILGNEVDDYTDYNWCGNISLTDYAAYYAHAFRLLYNSVKSQYSNARVYISLDHVWNFYRSYGFKGMDLLREFVAELDREGEITWNIAFHPYPSPITSANFWSNKSGVTNSSTSAIFTMLNLRYLTDYIKNTYGAEHRFILSETGYTSVSGGVSDETTQAAAIAYGYYLAEFNDMVDSFVIHRHVDHPAETSEGLYLGLWYTNSSYTDSASTKKFSWTVFKYMDTSQGAAYTNFALSIIGANSWSSIVPGYDASRFN